MRELDVLLERYLDRSWPGASPDRRAAFIALLEMQDPELAALCLGRSEAADPDLAALIAELTGQRPAELSDASTVHTDESGRKPRPAQDP